MDSAPGAAAEGRFRRRDAIAPGFREVRGPHASSRHSREMLVYETVGRTADARLRWKQGEGKRASRKSRPTNHSQRHRRGWRCRLRRANEARGQGVSRGPSRCRGVPRLPSPRTWSGRIGSETLQPSLNSRSSTSGRSGVGGVTAPPTSLLSLEPRRSKFGKPKSKPLRIPCDSTRVTIRKRPRTVLLENSFSAPVSPRIASSQGTPGTQNHPNIAQAVRVRPTSVDSFLVDPLRHPSRSRSIRSPGPESNLATDLSSTGLHDRSEYTDTLNERL
jgi:hypothetical protein